MRAFATSLSIMSGSLLAVFAVEEGTKPSGEAVVPILLVIFCISGMYALMTSQPVVARLAPAPTSAVAASASPESVAKRHARHVHGELDASRKKINAALKNGYFWNVALEGLQSTEWESGRDSLADEAPEVYDRVAAAYVATAALNDQANNHAQGGVDEFDATVATELRSARSRVTTAQTALKEFYSGS